MTEQLVTFETAKLAKEKGFTWNTRDVFLETLEHTLDCGRGDVITFPYQASRPCQTIRPYSRASEGYEREVAPAPTQSLLQKWLRDVHDIHVWCEKQHKDVPNKYGYRLGPDLEHSAFTYNDWSYEEALEEGLVEALNLINI